VALATGSRLGPYEIVAALGAGGMGEVYRGRDPRLGREVAIKVLAGALADAARLQRFEHEARSVAALSHPNIVALFDVGNGDPPFLVTELLDGETLRARLIRGPLPLGETIEMALQLVAGLTAAHGRGIVHRDLKPENVFVTRERVVKILDFGLAKSSTPIAGVDHDLTRAAATVDGMLLGTIGYMAPEQVRGRPADPRSDIFAVGLLLYEMVTGRRAFYGDSPADTMTAILKEEPHHLTVVGAIPPAIARVVRRCLEKEPENRFQSARDLRFALESCQADAVEAPTAKSVDKSIAVLPFTNMSGDPENQFFGDGLAEELINALTRLPGLRVASRSSAFRFGGREADISDVGRALRVATVLEGSVRRAGSRLRVTAQLINVADGYHIWSERYDREMADVFEIQDEIVHSIVEALAPALLGEARKVVRRPTDNMEAYELYLKGRHYWNQRMPSTMGLAIKNFEQVIVRDPDYALAYAGLADCYAIYRVYGWLSAEQTQPKALAAVTRAVALDPSAPEVNFSRALYAFYFEPGNWRTAYPYIEKVLAAGPRIAGAVGYAAVVLAMDGRAAEAMAKATFACDLDPLSPYIHYLAATAYNTLGRFQEAEQEATKVLELQPDTITGLWIRAVALCGLERYAEARAAGERVVSMNRAPIFVGLLALVAGLEGRAAEVQRLRDELSERQTRGEYVSPIGELSAAVGLGDQASVREALRACVADRIAPLTVAVIVGYWLNRLRSDPELDALCGQVLGENNRV